MKGKPPETKSRLAFARGSGRELDGLQTGAKDFIGVMEMFQIWFMAMIAQFGRSPNSTLQVFKFYDIKSISQSRCLKGSY